MAGESAQDVIYIVKFVLLKDVQSTEGMQIGRSGQDVTEIVERVNGGVEEGVSIQEEHMEESLVL